MVSRRQQSNPISPNAPVRFYKIVALTFLLLTVALLGVIIFMSSKRAAITITTKAEPVDTSTEVDIGTGDTKTDDLGSATTTMITYSQKFQPTGDKELPGVATGVVTLRNDSDAGQSLVPTTRLLSKDGILFRLKDRVTVPARGTATASVYADQEGVSGMIGPSHFTIPGLSDAKQKLIYADSTGAMIGGTKKIGVLTDDDVQKSEKILLAGVAEQAKAQFKDTHAGKAQVFKVIDYTIQNSAQLGAEVSEFTLTAKATVAAAFYDADKVKEMAKAALLKKAVSDTEIVELKGDGPTVTLDNFDSTTGVAKLMVFQTGEAVLNPESAQIQKQVLFGKSKEEVRRYLLSLSHVYAVDVEFHPAWMMTVPHVPDHVQVIVKNVE